MHSALCTADPWQGLPPLSGTGLLHTRVRFCCPLPHLELHSDHCDHGDQPPLTAQRKYSLSSVYECIIYNVYVCIYVCTHLYMSCPTIIYCIRYGRSAEYFSEHRELIFNLAWYRNNIVNILKHVTARIDRFMRRRDGIIVMAKRTYDDDDDDTGTGTGTGRAESRDHELVI